MSRERFTSHTHESQILIRPNFHIAYDTFGHPSHHPVILVMGLGVQMLGWHEEFCTALAEQGLWVIRFDNRDIGRSTKMSHLGVPTMWDMTNLVLNPAYRPLCYTLHDMAVDTIQLMDALGIEQAHVVGASMGGMIAQEMAIHYEHRLLSLSLIMSSLSAKPLISHSWRWLPHLVRPQSNHKPKFIEQGVQAWQRLHGVNYPFDVQEMVRRAELAYNRGHYPIGRRRQLMAMLASPNRTQALGEVKLPTLIIHGNADPLVPVESALALSAALPHAKTLFLEGMGHFLHRELWPHIVTEIARQAHMATIGYSAVL